MNIHGHVCKGRSCQYYAPSLFFYCKAKVFINNWGQGGGGERQARRWGRGKGPRGRREPAGGARGPSAGSLGGPHSGSGGPLFKQRVPGLPAPPALAGEHAGLQGRVAPNTLVLTLVCRGLGLEDLSVSSRGLELHFRAFSGRLGGPQVFLNNFLKCGVVPLRE